MQKKPALKLIVVFTALAFAKAHAVNVDAYARYKLGSAPVVELHDSGSNYADVLDFSSDAANNSSGIHTYSSGTNFGSRTDGAGIFDVFGQVVVTDSFTNNTANAVHAIFSFNLIPGQLANTINTSFAAGEYVKSGFNINIKSNGTSVWQSTAQLYSDQNALGVFSQTGQNFGLSQTSATQYLLPGYHGQIDLGWLAAGESTSIEYSMSTFAQGISYDHGSTTTPAWTEVIPEHQRWVSPSDGDWTECVSWGDDYSVGYQDCYGGIALHHTSEEVGHWETVPEQVIEHPETTTWGLTNGAIAQSGDPFSIGGEYFGNYDGYGPYVTGIQVAAVPEPETFAMLGMGLGVVALARRRALRSA